MERSRWLDASELRIGLGCMRLSTDEHRNEERGLETIHAAAEAGITVFDTARSYALDETELGHNERLLAEALRRSGAESRARVVTKGGMARSGGVWVPDGRAKSIRSDCVASLAALDGLPIDLYLVHAPDPRTPWATSVRALARLVDDGLVERIGLANVNRRQLDEALELVPVAAVQVPLSPFDVRALRGGVVERCAELGIPVIAHSPLGGPRRAGTLERRRELVEIAEAHGATPAQIALAWLLSLSPAVVAIPGARRPEAAVSAARAAAIRLRDDERAALDRAFGRPGATETRHRARRRDGRDVVLVMGIPGAGKSRAAEELATRGYLRLNRDERGGSLRELAGALEEALASGASQVVLDNTYLTRSSRSYVVEAARRHGAVARCLWLDTPLAQAQINLVERLLDRFGRLPTPAELRQRARAEEGLLAPTSQMRALRELEPPTSDEGFATVERVPFARAQQEGIAAVFIAATAASKPGWARALDGHDGGAPHLVFHWSSDVRDDEVVEAATRVQAEVSGLVEGALCPHGGGPPTCWCRPPLPGLPLTFARRHGVDPARSTLIGTSPAHRTLANALGARYLSS